MSSNDEKNRPDEPKDAKWRPTRRTFLWLGAGTAAGALLLGRTCFYDADSWSGRVLGEWEAAVLAAAAGALIPDEPGELPSPGPSGLQVARNVDRFLQGMPNDMLLEIHGMFGLIEHGTLLTGNIQRFTRLSPADRLDSLTRLHEMGGKFGQAFKGMRDLCLLGWYSDRRTWKPIGYDGPLLERPAPPPVVTRDKAAKYAELIAPSDQSPRGVQ